MSQMLCSYYTWIVRTFHLHSTREVTGDKEETGIKDEESAGLIELFVVAASMIRQVGYNCSSPLLP